MPFLRIAVERRWALSGLLSERAGGFNPIGMNKNIDLRKIVEKLKEPYDLASNHACISTHQFWLDFYYAAGAAIWEMEKVLGQKEETLQEFSQQLYKTCSDAEEGQFSLPRLRKMNTFYLAYCNIMNDLIWEAIRKVKWQHHTKHLCKIADPQQRIFYLLETVKNEWTCETLGNKIKNDYYRRQGQMLSNFDTTLSPELSKLAQSAFLKIYSFEFVKTKHITEKELEEFIDGHRKQFINEFGSDFIYIDRQHKVKCEGKVYFLDLILYHNKLNCFVIIELKRKNFKPEYVGKLNRYLQCANQVFNTKNNNNVIGIVLCESANDPAVANDLKNSRLPIGVATYYLGG